MSHSFIITGTSGTGKTALVSELRARGFAVYDEATRLILQQQSAVNGDGLPSKSPERFVDLMLEYCVKCLVEAELDPLRMTFFDRGIPDVAAYAVRFGVNPEKVYRAALEHLFNRNVFVLPPWKEIFVTDEFRGRTFDEYQVFHQMILDAYDRAGCRLMEVPTASVSERADYVVAEARKLATQ